MSDSLPGIELEWIEMPRVSGRTDGRPVKRQTDGYQGLVTTLNRDKPPAVSGNASGAGVVGGVCFPTPGV